MNKEEETIRILLIGDGNIKRESWQNDYH